MSLQEAKNISKGGGQATNPLDDVSKSNAIDNPSTFNALKRKMELFKSAITEGTVSKSI